ncbi:hypothetical protein P3L10_011090 [Capsicum annuum]
MSPKRKETETESGSTFDHPTKKARVQIDSEELPEQSQLRKNKDEESDNSFSPMGHDLRSNPSMILSKPLVSTVEKYFDEFRSIMKNENIDELFKRSYFAYFFKFPEDRTLCFQMSMVYGLLKRRVKYVGDDKDPKEVQKKMDEIWINYSGMPVCLGLKEFAIVMGLRCDRSEEPLIKETPSNKCKEKKMGYWELLDDLSTGAITLYGFSWDFMACSFEVIPPLQKQFKDYSDEVSHPRILRWLAAIGSQTIKEVVLPWIVPTEQELGIFVDTIADPTVELIKKKLTGEIAIRRAVRQGQSIVEALHDQPTAIDSRTSSGGVAGRVVDNGGSHPDAATASSCDYEHVGAEEKINTFGNTPCIGPSHPSLPLCSHCKCKVCKDREDKLFEKLEAITEVVEELKSKRGVIPSNKGPLKKVDIYAALGYEKKKKLQEIMTGKTKLSQEYTMHSFDAEDFTSMTNMREWYYVDEILYLMRGRQLAYPNAYDATDGIMELNFYNSFKSRGKMSYPHGKSWTKAKRILTVINVEVKYFLVVEILLDEEKIKVYDCNLHVFKKAKIFTPRGVILEVVLQVVDAE